jgi:hypothetical protein
MSGAETIAVNDHNNEPDDNISNSNNSRLLSLLFSRHCSWCWVSEDHTQMLCWGFCSSGVGDEVPGKRVDA